MKLESLQKLGDGNSTVELPVIFACLQHKMERQTQTMTSRIEKLAIVNMMMLIV